MEDEWKRGRERIRERLMDGIEERRRRAREEKDGEGAAGGMFTVRHYLFTADIVLQMLHSTRNLVPTSPESFASLEEAPRHRPPHSPISNPARMEEFCPSPQVPLPRVHS